MQGEAKEAYAVGSKVTWLMFDGHVMCGDITFIGYETYMLRRVDGSQVQLNKDKILRLASYEDVMAACDFFTQRP